MAAPLLSAVDKSVCRFCGSNVSKAFRRTFGDNDDVAHRCLECDTETRIESGSAAGYDVPDKLDPADPEDNLARADTPALNGGGPT